MLEDFEYDPDLNNENNKNLKYHDPALKTHSYDLESHFINIQKELNQE
jgi:hypothetical protein